MNYVRIYNQIVLNRQMNDFDGYSEFHHIVPKSLGGSDNRDNLVRLTAREHFICHLLLTKIYPKDSIEWIKMMKAFSMMYYQQSSNQFRYNNSRWYKYFKENFSRAQSLNQSGCGNSQYGSIWISNLELKQSKKVSKLKVQIWLDKGWIYGRIINWDNLKQFRNITNEKTVAQVLSSNRKQEIIKKQNERKLKRQVKFSEYKKLYNEYYKLYDQYGWNKFCEITNWKYSKPYLVKCFNKYVDSFVPQNGKRRGKHI